MATASYAPSAVSTSRTTVSVGLPVYNGARDLPRALDSLLAQTHPDVEIVISDNASDDDTQRICERYAGGDARIRYHRQARNVGATDNFCEVLRRAGGRYFMWLGHDDWLDADYLERCVAVLEARPEVALACGRALYHRHGERAGEGKNIQLLQDNPRWRVLAYLSQVTDNGTFYGVMRREQVERIELRNVPGADWLVVASLAYVGKVVTLDGTFVHRGVGGSSRSLRSQTDALRLPPWQARWVFVALPLAVFRDIGWESDVFGPQSLGSRLTLGAAAASLSSLRPLVWAMRERFGRER